MDHALDPLTDWFRKLMQEPRTVQELIHACGRSTSISKRQNGFHRREYSTWPYYQPERLSLPDPDSSITNRSWHRGSRQIRARCLSKLQPGQISDKQNVFFMCNMVENVVANKLQICDLHSEGPGDRSMQLRLWNIGVRCLSNKFRIWKLHHNWAGCDRNTWKVVAVKTNQRLALWEPWDRSMQLRRLWNRCLLPAQCIQK